MATPPHSRLPRLVEGIDLRTLPIGPAEAFVLSHVDGTASESEIADEAGLDPAGVAQKLETLAALGAIRFEQPPASESLRPPRPAARVSSSVRIGPIIEANAQQERQHPASALYDASELDPTLDIPADRQRTILETFYRLDNITHYEILRVDASADKRAIKNAYFEIVNVFHPDRYFGKRLGAFKAKLERVFARLTEAHDALTRSGPRAEYDAYLAARHKTRLLEQPDVGIQAQIQAIQRQIAEEARGAEEARSAQASLGPGSASLVPGSAVPAPERSPSGSPSPSSGSQPRLPSQRPVDAEARKRALARKLGGRHLSGPLPAVTPSMAPASGRAEIHERAAADLKRRLEQRVSAASVDRAERYLANARQSLANKDPVSAATALRIAQSLVPDNPELASRLQQAQTEAESQLANHYLVQAEYEEREGRMPEAARSYARAILGSPSARTLERAAYCALLASGDLRLAGDHARRAVAIAPEDAQARVTLARIYIAAGMKQSGLAEFERAATLAPKDDTIRDWIRRLKRGEA